MDATPQLFGVECKQISWRKENQCTAQTPPQAKEVHSVIPQCSYTQTLNQPVSQASWMESEASQAASPSNDPIAQSPSDVISEPQGGRKS